MGTVSYAHIKLLAEVIAFSVLTITVVMAMRIRKRLGASLGEREINNMMVGFLIFWSGYLVNVLNDIITTEFMKVFDDVLVAVGLAWILVTVRPIYGKLRLKSVPSKVFEGTKVLRSGGYLFNASIPLQRLLQLLGGWKLLAVARNAERFNEFGIPTLWITKVGGENRIEPTRLAPLMHYLIERTDESTAVILEGVEYLILENGFETVFKFLTSLKDNVLSKKALLVLILDPRTFDERELKLLEREFSWLNVS
ncbi:DUF835 domain-containing protein [Thermococcus sp. AM4]|uniref:DUF835 domain-containing protein n=1 Tax=Thermococcus sp. (strain AM4) TaxID=246969 RepID=UPI00064E5D26|nr:DUF835 domain-containing protein [Thermococcus sp. AM4]